jgi:hypothetical protein
VADSTGPELVRRELTKWLENLKDVRYLPTLDVYSEGNDLFVEFPPLQPSLTLKVVIDPWTFHVYSWLMERRVEERDTVQYMSWLHGLLYRLAWPPYECGDCLGLGPEHGCNCAWYGAEAPGVPCSEWRVHARRLWSVVASRCGMYDPVRRTRE